MFLDTDAPNTHLNININSNLKELHVYILQRQM